jgi:hypothetical protein
LVWDKHNNIFNLWNKVKQLLWDKHNNILNLWNKAIGVGQT